MNTSENAIVCNIPKRLLPGYRTKKYNNVTVLLNNKLQTNLTKLCASFGKSYDDWYNKPENQEFISRLRLLYQAKGKNPEDVVTTFIATGDPSHDGVYGCIRLYFKVCLAVSEEFRNKCNTQFMPAIKAEYRERVKTIVDESES